MPLTNSSTNCMSFRLSSDKYLTAYQNSTVITSWHYFLDRFVLQFIVKIFRTIVNWSSYLFMRNALTSHIFIASCEKYGSIDTICEHWMIVTCWYQVNWLIHFHLDWNAFFPLSSKSSFIITTKSKHWSFSSEDNSVKGATCNFVNFSFEKRIWDKFIFFFFVFIILVHIKVLKRS